MACAFSAPCASMAETAPGSSASAVRRSRIGRSRLDERLGEVVLQLAVLPIGAGQGGRALSGGHGQELQQVGDAGLGLGVVADLAVGVGDRPLDLAVDRRRPRRA